VVILSANRSRTIQEKIVLQQPLVERNVDCRVAKPACAKDRINIQRKNGGNAGEQRRCYLPRPKYVVELLVMDS
jgi:hypothetical protein